MSGPTNTVPADGDWGHAQLMPHVVAKQPVEQPAPAGFTVHALLQNPEFRPVLQAAARTLISVNDLFPRIARLVASHQKWMLTQAAYALHLERDPDNPDSGITAARLLKLMRDTGGASRNTTAAFLAELVAYKLLRPAAGGRTRKARPLEPTEASRDAMQLWFRSQMSTLDLLDGGNRVRRVEDDATIFERAQPLAARRLLADVKWTKPPDGIAVFVWSESGGIILDDLMAHPPSLAPVDGKIWIDVNLAKLAEHYLISNTHLRRLFAYAETGGYLGRADAGRRGRFWLSARLVEEYASWQAIKVEALASAFDQAADRH